MENNDDIEDFSGPFDTSQQVPLPTRLFEQVLQSYQEYRAKTTSSFYAELPELNRMMAGEIDTFLLLHKSQLTPEVKQHWAEIVELVKSKNDEAIYTHINTAMHLLTRWAKDMGVITGTVDDQVGRYVDEIGEAMVLAGQIQSIKRGGESIEFKGTLKEFMEANP